MATCYTSYDLTHTPLATPASIGSIGTCGRSQTTSGASLTSQQKDYSRPLHVDCSVEYELPNQAKPPAGVRNEPLLMIHPCYFRKIESQRRSPFVNNLPTRTTQPHPHTQPHQQTTAATPTPASTAIASKRRAAARGQQLPQQVPQQAAQYPVQYAQHQLWDPMPHLVPNIAATTATPVGGYCGANTNMSSMTSGHSHSKRQADAANSMLANINVNLLGANCGSYTNTSDMLAAHCWTEPDRSPDRPEDIQQRSQNHLSAAMSGNISTVSSGGGTTSGAGAGKHILSGKYRQYLRAHRLHPYVASALPLASTFPQLHQQVCYNV